MYIDEEKLKKCYMDAGYSSYEGITQAAAEKGIRLSIVTVYNIANNKNWTRDKVLALAATLGCKVEDFLTLEAPREGPAPTSPPPIKNEEEQEPVLA